MCFCALHDLKVAVVKSKRNLAEVSFHLEVFPEMNLHMIMKSETDNLTVPGPFDTTVTVRLSGHLSCPLPRPWRNHCLPAGMFLVYAVCHYLRFQSNKGNQQANKAFLYNLCDYFCVPGKPSPTLWQWLPTAAVPHSVLLPCPKPWAWTSSLVHLSSCTGQSDRAEPAPAGALLGSEKDSRKEYHSWKSNHFQSICMSCLLLKLFRSCQGRDFSVTVLFSSRCLKFPCSNKHTSQYSLITLRKPRWLRDRFITKLTGLQDTWC